MVKFLDRKNYDWLKKQGYVYVIYFEKHDPLFAKTIQDICDMMQYHLREEKNWKALPIEEALYE
jgi:hypothetical protein